MSPLSEKEACQQALQIYGIGACNPLGVSRTLAEMCRASIDWPSTTDGFNDVRRHPAIRLVCYQLAFLMGMEPIAHSDLITEAEKACQQIVEA